MNIKELECFLAVCEDRSINKAAKRIFISVQGLSRMIKKLESELGTDVLHRTAQGIELTEQGRILEKHARTILDHMSSMNREIEKSTNGLSGELKVALSYGILGYYKPTFIMEFRSRFPNITLQFGEYTDQKAQDSLWFGESDVAIAYAPVDEERFESKVLDENELFMVVNKENPLSRKDVVTMEDLKGQPVVIQNREFNIHRLVVTECEKLGFHPNIVFESNGICTCNRLCNINRGVSVAMRNTIDDIKGDNLVLIPFEDHKYTLKIVYLHRRNCVVSGEMLQFEKFITEWSDHMKAK